MGRLDLLPIIFLAIACDTAGPEGDVADIDFLMPRCGPSTPDALYCFELGKRYLEAREVARDPARARRYFETACDLELPRACHNLALMARDGQGGPADKPLAEELFQKACDRNNGPSCAQLAEMRLLAPDPSNPRSVRDALAKACRLGYPRACNGYGILISAAPQGPTDTADAWWGYYEACEGGAAEACDRLRALAEDPRVEMLSACAGGDGNACRFLGMVEDNGRFGPRDRTAARRYYDRACALGLSTACNDLGEMWARGLGGPASLEEAAPLFDRACRLDGLLGCANLAALREWRGDLPGARRLRERACFNGHGASCARLAWFWSWGWGGPKDLARAAVLLSQACDLGDEAACERREGGDR